MHPGKIQRLMPESSEVEPSPENATAMLSFFFICSQSHAGSDIQLRRDRRSRSNHIQS